MVGQITRLYHLKTGQETPEIANIWNSSIPYLNAYCIESFYGFWGLGPSPLATKISQLAFGCQKEAHLFFLRHLFGFYFLLMSKTSDLKNTHSLDLSSLEGAIFWIRMI